MGVLSAVGLGMPDLREPQPCQETAMCAVWASEAWRASNPARRWRRIGYVFGLLEPRLPHVHVLQAVRLVVQLREPQLRLEDGASLQVFGCLGVQKFVVVLFIS